MGKARVYGYVKPVQKIQPDKRWQKRERTFAEVLAEKRKKHETN